MNISQEIYLLKEWVASFVNDIGLTRFIDEIIEVFRI